MPGLLMVWVFGGVTMVVVMMVMVGGRALMCVHVCV
jgi:hypothetical protein